MEAMSGEMSAPARNKKEQHGRRMNRFTGPIRRVWYKTSQLVGIGTHKILVDWPFMLLCRHIVDYNLLNPSVEQTEIKSIDGYRNHYEWLADHCSHGWWWQEHGGRHNFLIHFRYKQDALRFKLIWG